MKFTLKILLTFSITINCFAQLSEDRVLAWVGSKPIYEDEFIKRYEMTPQFGRHVKTAKEELKLRFLYTLIAEKLWALNALSQSSDTTSAYQTAIKTLEKMFVRDALYRTAILDSIKISSSEISEGLKRLSLKYNIRYIQTHLKSVAENFYNLLKNGFPVDSILFKDSYEFLVSEQSEITFGDMLPFIEDSVYSLSPNEITCPIETQDRWFLFYVVGIGTNTLDKTTNPNAVVESIIKKRKETVLYNRLLRKILSGIKVDFQREIFDSLASVMTLYMNEKCVNNKAPRKLPYFFGPSEIQEFKSKLHAISPVEKFILFDEDPISFKQFIDDLFFDGLTIKTTGRNEIAKLLDYKVLSYIERELLAREAFKHALNNIPPVKKELAMWKDYYLQQSSMNEEIKVPPLNDSTLYAYFLKNKKMDTAEVVRIKYFFHNDIGLVREVFDKVKSGLELDIPGLEQTLEYPSLSNSEWFPEFQVQKLLGVTEELNENELYGPVQTNGGFLIVVVINKTRINTGMQDFTSMKIKLKNELALELSKKKLTARTAELASQHKITIDWKVLSELKLTNVNLFTVRNMGFGGNISGVPINTPNYEWVELMSSQKLVP